MALHKIKKNKILVLLDFENLLINYSSRLIIEELNKTLKQIAQEIGEISKVFVFVPHNTASLFAKDFYMARFITILCPKIKAKNGQTDNDTTDEIMLGFGQEIITEMPSLTHLFIGSGDIDFLPLIIKASRTGLNVGLIVSGLNPLSFDLIKRIDKKPGTNEKMVYVLSLLEREN